MCANVRRTVYFELNLKKERKKDEKMINVRPLCKALAIKASKELNEVPARVPEDIETLREWLLSQKHLKTPLGE